MRLEATKYLSTFFLQFHFHTCVIPISIVNTDVPKNFLGYQIPTNGNAYAGIVAYASNNSREFVQVKLVQKLDFSTYYCSSFKLSLGDTSSWAVNKLGAHFSADTLYPQPYQSIPTPPWSIFTYYVPQIESTTFLTDTSNWSSISGTFQANGNEEYITIGNFRDDAGTDTLRVRNSGYYVSYYYIDDVSVEEVIAANAGNDTSIISADSIQLGNNPTENATYLWQPAYGLSDVNAANPMALPYYTTTYVVTKTQCNVITTDTVIVSGSVGINENDERKRIKLFPNPGNGNVTIECALANSETGMLLIYDLTGRLVFSDRLNSSGLSVINIEELDQGTYLYEIVVNDKKVKKDKLIIIK